MSEAIWLIWSNEHGAWWGSSPDNFNYVSVIGYARRYTLEKASQIVDDANRFQREGDAPNEVKVLAPEAADRLIGNLVDRIVAKVAEANAREIEKAGKEMGNDQRT